MLRQDSDEPQVAFHDASTFFSGEEWKLLHEWQKELYRNVMKEIHQALISLGPLIATTVFSLKSKEKAEPCLMGNQDYERRHRINHSPSDPMANHDELFKINNKENLHLNNPQDSEGRQRNDCIGADEEQGFPFLNPDISLNKEEEPVSIFIDHLGAEIGESSTDPIPGHEVVSFCIKSEEEAYCTDPLDSESIENFSFPGAGNGTMNRKREARGIVKRTGKATRGKALSGSAKVKMVHSNEKGTQARGQPWSDIKQEPVSKEALECKSSLSGPAQFSFHQEPPSLQGCEMCDDWGSNPYYANPFPCPPTVKKSGNVYSCTECLKSFRKKEYLIGHKKTHVGVRPYQCNECEKSFRRKDNLLVHKRTHTGERPYSCSICEKSFNQKGALNRHKRAHMGERPYQCDQCEKSFRQNGTLIAHQRTHIHP